MLEDLGVDVGPGADGAVWDGGPIPDLDVPVLALAEDLDSARQALGAGADGVVLRDGDVVRIRAALEALHCGLRVVDAAFDSLLKTSNDLELLEPLTSRETEVLELLAQGLANRAIAKRLELSEHTVKFHVNALLQKLDARNRTDAVVRATRMGILRL